MKEIGVSGNSVIGTVCAPSSKSHFIRLLAGACHASGQSRIKHHGICADVSAALRVCEELGAQIKEEAGEMIVQGKKRLKSRVLHCGESGLCLRMFSPLAALQKEEICLEAEGSLLKRPVRMIEEGLKQLSVRVSSLEGRPPVWVNGPLKSGKLKVDGSQSSQFISGLLMALPQAEGNSMLTVLNPASIPYIEMTLMCLQEFGIRIEQEDPYVYHIPGDQEFESRTDLVCEGDWSAAANLLVAGAIGGDLTIRGLSASSAQADKAILQVLWQVGARVELVGENEYRIQQSSLRAFQFDLKHQPDLAPPLAVLALAAEGVSELKGMDRLYTKESDRANCLSEEFKKLGADIQIRENSLWIRGGRLRTARVDAHNDHRLAMAFGLAALLTDGEVRIKGAEAVRKSYPAFFTDLKTIGLQITD